MKNIFIALLVISLASCRSAPEPPNESTQMALDTLEYYATEMDNAGEPTDARVEAAIPKIPQVTFPSTQTEACRIIGIPEIWKVGRYFIRPAGEHQWITYPLTDNYCISFRTPTNDFERVFDLKIVKDFDPEKK